MDPEDADSPDWVSLTLDDFGYQAAAGVGEAALWTSTEGAQGSDVCQTPLGSLKKLAAVLGIVEAGDA